MKPLFQRQIPFCLVWVLLACQGEPLPPDADVIVVGAGIAGLSAALEASDAGAEVLVIETSSVSGGHAVIAGGFALVGTPLQERKGLTDTPEIAYQDLMAWGEDADPEWVRAYAEKSRTEVYDWLTAFGVKFFVVIDTPEDTVPRFHFTRGTAVNVIVPMLHAALDRDNLHLRTNTSVTALTVADGKVTGVKTRDTRTGMESVLSARSVILATGGFQSNLDMVRAHWRTEWPAERRMEPDTLLIGSARFATGIGIELGESAGAGVSRMDHQVTFVNGLPDPRQPAHGLNTENPAAIRVNSNGERFVSESVDSKEYEAAVFAQSPQMHWLIFDAKGRRKLRIRGASWLNADTITAEILDTPEVGHKSETIEALATATGLPSANLRATVDRYNQFVTGGEDLDFQRFDTDSAGPKPVAIIKPPFYGLQLLPMTRKSLGGLAIDSSGQVLDTRGQKIAGLFAAGELTGVAGINGSHGGSGTFLGPSVFIGRIAGKMASPPVSDTKIVAPVSDTGATILVSDTGGLAAMVENARPGYWHFEKSHATVLEREYACERCHSSEWPTGPALTKLQMHAQLDSCTQCH